MACLHSARMLIPQFQPNCLNNAILPLVQNMVDGVHVSPSSVREIFYKSGLNSLSPSLAVLRSLPKAYPNGTMDVHVDVKDATDNCDGLLLAASMDSSMEENLKNEIDTVEFSDSSDIESVKSLNEEQRRMKIGLANKGKVPWNKGRKHSAENRGQIKPKTIEALKDPKVRKKRCEHYQLHRENISSSVKYAWHRRSKIKQLKEMFLQSWRLGIANAAKKGGTGQEEIEWDSYSDSSHIKRLKEKQRRMGIALANKGKVPWNKGQKQSAETRERIKQKTIEAMRDPKVRRKLCEHPQPHSEDSKAKISSSLRSTWCKRLKIKQSWRLMIANAAKKGGIGQEELEWNRDSKIKQQLLVQELHCSAGETNKIETATIRAEKLLLSRAESIAEAANIGGRGEQDLECSDSSMENSFNNEIDVIECSDSLDIEDIKHLREKQRRMRIGLSNKGKVPWNKGLKHSSETRKRIQQKTIEALRDPKVRMKMSYHPQPHSDEIKAKISSSLKNVWRKRLEEKWSEEKFLQSWKLRIANASKMGGRDQEELEWDSYRKIKQQLLIQELRLSAEEANNKKESGTIKAKKIFQSWAESVATAAKKGGSGEQKLRWDSYDRIKQEMVLLAAAEKAKAKEAVRIRASWAARIKAIKKEMSSRQKKEQVEKMKSAPKVKQKSPTHKSDNGTATLDGGTWNSPFSVWENLNLELIKKENLQKQVSLAEQIRAARSMKAHVSCHGSLTSD